MKKFLSTVKGKLLAISGLALVGTSAFADNVGFSGEAFTGTFDLGPYKSAIGIIVVAVAFIAAVRAGISQFKRV